LCCLEKNDELNHLKIKQKTRVRGVSNCVVVWNVVYLSLLNSAQKIDTDLNRVREKIGSG
jgi:hypothetical protein